MYYYIIKLLLGKILHTNYLLLFYNITPNYIRGVTDNFYLIFSYIHVLHHAIVWTTGCTTLMEREDIKHFVLAKQILQIDQSSTISLQ
uniref:Uncharacterized protein n=1 Tax=Arundo donax TaxID=35708 RepID=A0A0A9HI32_ARUDO